MKTIEARVLKDEFYDKWVSPSGLALLGVGHGDNSNGILFYAFFMQLCKDVGVLDDSDKTKARALIESLERESGLLNRRPNDPTLEAHDNYVGAMALCEIFDMYGEFSERCLQYGLKHGWNYNNTNPNDWIKESQRQGGEIAFYQIAGHVVPDVFYTIWLAFGLCLAAFGSPSVVNLAWLRFKVLQSALKKQPAYFPMPILFIAKFFYSFVVNFVREGQQEIFRKYYNDTIYYRMFDLVARY